MKRFLNYSAVGLNRLRILLLICVGLIGNVSVLASDLSDAVISDGEIIVDDDIAGILQKSGAATIFSAALASSSQWQEVVGADEATVFAPTDLALKRAGSAFLLEQVLVKPENAERLNNLMAQHFVPSPAIKTNELETPMNYADGNGGCISVSPVNFATKVGPEAYIIESIKATNGYIHFIDRMLWTPYYELTDCLIKENEMKTQ